MSDLVVVFADEDARRAVQAMITRGVGRCLSPFDARYLRHTGRDARVAQQPIDFLRESAALHATSRYLVLWDHHGSGRERQAPSDVEADVCRMLVGAGIAEANVAAIAFVPELEVVLAPVWERTLTLLAAGGSPNPAGPVPFDREHPREKSWIPAVRATKQRLGAEHFRRVAAGLSLPALKSEPASPLHRISQALQTWFPKATDQ